ncbi:MAG: hypothetical protein ACR2O6_13955 [Ilumatobacteraceae bacterium]
MFFWFIGTAVVTVGLIFRDPGFDYRLLIVGSVLPLTDGLFGGARALHSVTVSIVLLVVVMLATIGRRRLRKLLLGLPIGMFLHLVFDGAWNDTETFWWPFTGTDFTADELPVVERGWWSLVLELIGLVVCAWLWRRNELGEAARRRAFLHDGQLVAVPDRFG